MDKHPELFFFVNEFFCQGFFVNELHQLNELFFSVAVVLLLQKLDLEHSFISVYEVLIHACFFLSTNYTPARLRRELNELFFFQLV